MHDQADELRQLVRMGAMHTAHDGPPPPRIVVAGGKPNVGATTLALNLAVAFCGQGQRIVLVDADLDRSGVASLCEIAERLSIVDVIAGQRSIHEILQRGPAGMQIVPGAWAPAAATNSTATSQAHLLDQLNQLGPYADALVIDVGSSRSPLSKRLWQSADMVVLVTTPEPDAIMDSYAAIKVLLGPATTVPVQTLVNLAAGHAVAVDVHGRIAQACQRFLGVQIGTAGYVPSDSIIAQAASSRSPFLLSSPRCGAARNVERMAETLWAQVTKQPASSLAATLAKTA